MVNLPIDVSVVIPTFREAPNVLILVPRLAAALDRAGYRSEIIVVDDGSADGTDAICASLAQTIPLQLVERMAERGLATAVNLGLRNVRGEILVVMDADLSHPPEAVPQLVAACQSPFVDFVIGSRYVEGGSIEQAWPLFRRLNSRFASLLAIGLTTARDPLSGFFAIKRSTLSQAVNLKPIGYKIGLELIVRCDCRRIVEQPIAFHRRVHGRSKLSIKQQWQYLHQIARLYSAKYPGPSQFIRFGLVGLSGMVIDLISFTLLLVWSPLWLSRIIAIGCGMTWNYALNRRMTFCSAAPQPLLRTFVKFCAGCLLGAIINGSATLALCAVFNVFARVPIVAAAIGIVAGAICNYTICRRWVFAENVRVDLGTGDAETPIARSESGIAA
jgi:dolichol-phosphate mannosyltransferase